MLHIGYKNYIAKEKVLVIADCNTKPQRRKRYIAEDLDKLIDCTMGNKTKSLIHLTDGFIVASGITTQNLCERWLKNV